MEDDDSGGAAFAGALDALFADLEAQADALANAERAAEAAERTRGEVGRLGLTDRLRAAVDAPVRLRVAGTLVVSGRVLRVGPDWVLLDEGAGREVVVSRAAVVGIRGLPRYAAVPDSMPVVDSRITLRLALRGIARDRATVRLHLVDGSTVDATLDRVGADYVDVAAHAAGEARRRRDVRDVESIPITAIAAVRRAAAG